MARPTGAYTKEAYDFHLRRLAPDMQVRVDNLFEVARTTIKAKDKLPTGRARIQVETTYVERNPAGPLKVNGNEVASGVVPVSAPLGFTANDALDFGINLGSPVGREYHEKAPFKFDGTIGRRRWSTPRDRGSTGV